ncbi:MAG: hypothetical protein KDA05_03910 [Phycisphaerales bacterium]|nr:hypothetical protein [Phycisphaerales bacterium]
MNISVEGNIDDDAPDIASLLRTLSPIHNESAARSWKFRCDECRYLGPWAASVLASAYLVGKQRDQRPRIHLPTEPAPLKAFCQFSGMEHLFAGGAKPDPTHPENETVPLERFDDANWGRSGRVVNLLKRHVADLDTEVEDRIRLCIQETTQNILDHAKSPIGGVMAARFIESRGEVRVGIVDRGIGIHASLATRYPELGGVQDSLARVIDGGHSSRSRPSNMGQGISNLFSVVRFAGGRMAIFTEDAVATTHEGSPANVRSTGFTFPGTAVFFALPTDPS